MMNDDEASFPEQPAPKSNKSCTCFCNNNFVCWEIANLNVIWNMPDRLRCCWPKPVGKNAWGPCRQEGHKKGEPVSNSPAGQLRQILAVGTAVFPQSRRQEAARPAPEPDAISSRGTLTPQHLGCDFCHRGPWLHITQNGADFSSAKRETGLSASWTLQKSLYVLSTSWRDGIGTEEMVII